MKTQRSKFKLKDIWFFNQGHIRHKLYYGGSFWSRFLRPHILEQIEARISSMNSECYNSGSCIKCGCTTTALQMADKACDGACYPSMQDKLHWDRLKTGKTIYDRQTRSFWLLHGKIFSKLTNIKIKENGKED